MKQLPPPSDKSTVHVLAEKLPLTAVLVVVILFLTGVLTPSYELNARAKTILYFIVFGNALFYFIHWVIYQLTKQPSDYTLLMFLRRELKQPNNMDYQFFVWFSFFVYIIAMLSLGISFIVML